MPSFDNLPPEITLEILKLVPDIKTLKALLLASPTTYHAYVPIREEIYTLITFKILASRGLDPATLKNAAFVKIVPAPCSAQKLDAANIKSLPSFKSPQPMVSGFVREDFSYHNLTSVF